MRGGGTFCGLLWMAGARRHSDTPAMRTRSSRRRWTTDDACVVRASSRIILDAGMSKRQDSSHVFSPLFVSLVGWWTIRHHLRHMHDPPSLLVGGSLLSCRPHRHKRLAFALLLLLSLPAHGPRPPSGRGPKKNLACSAFPNYSSLHIRPTCPPPPPPPPQPSCPIRKRQHTGGRRGGRRVALLYI